MGTTGTIMGTSTFLKEKNPDIKIIGVQPDGDSSIPGIRKWSSEYLPKIYNPAKVDQLLEVSEEDARVMARRLASEEGIFSGMSSGGAVAAAIRLIETLDGGVVVAVICDRGDRYLSSDLFE
jgi:cysteine synthase B